MDQLEAAGFKKVRSAVVPNFRFKKDATQRAAEGFGVKGVWMGAIKPS